MSQQKLPLRKLPSETLTRLVNKKSPSIKSCLRNENAPGITAKCTHNKFVFGISLSVTSWGGKITRKKMGDETSHDSNKSYQRFAFETRVCENVGARWNNEETLGAKKP